MTPLSECQAEIRSATIEGHRVQILWLQWAGKQHGIPFTDEPFHQIRLQPGTPNERDYNVWERKSGSTIQDLTLSPSYNCTAPASHRLHCHIRAGEIEGPL